MRVNVDSSAIRDPRVYLLARALDRNKFEVLGRLISVWMVCYERRSSILRGIEIDIAADLDGFANGMLEAQLADVTEGTDALHVRGVVERIEFLEKQKRKGELSGEMRRAKATINQQILDRKQAAAQQRLDLGSSHTGTAVEQRFDLRRTTHRTYSPAPDQDLSPDQAPDHVARATGDEGGSDGNGQAPQAHSEPADAPVKGKAPKALPEMAYTLAWQLLNAVRENHPSSRVAKLPERMQGVTAERWAETIDKLHRIDGFDWGVIGGMISWCQRDTFWRGVILGADNLRDKWDKIAAQRNRSGPPQAQQRKGPTELALEEQRELERVEREQEQTA